MESIYTCTLLAILFVLIIGTNSRHWNIEVGLSLWQVNCCTISQELNIFYISNITPFKDQATLQGILRSNYILLG